MFIYSFILSLWIWIKLNKKKSHFDETVSIYTCLIPVETLTPFLYSITTVICVWRHDVHICMIGYKVLFATPKPFPFLMSSYINKRANVPSTNKELLPLVMLFASLTLKCLTNNNLKDNFISHAVIEVVRSTLPVDIHLKSCNMLSFRQRFLW